MVKAVSIADTLKDLRLLEGRHPETTPEEMEGVFATLANCGETGGIFLGSFQGDSAWERHGAGDELVQIIAGATELTILTEDGPTVLEMSEGMLTVVPQGCWHRFHAPDHVTVMTMTPQPTDHSLADDPTAEEH